jgi:hypothetical protein
MIHCPSSPTDFIWMKKLQNLPSSTRAVEREIHSFPSVLFTQDLRITLWMNLSKFSMCTDLFFVDFIAVLIICEGYKRAERVCIKNHMTDVKLYPGLLKISETYINIIVPSALKYDIRKQQDVT